MNKKINRISGKTIQPLFTNSHGSYKALLLDKRWKEKRKQILIKDSHKCKCCNSIENLQVHHRQYHYSLNLRMYLKPWEYNDSLLITLCHKCHQKGHQLYKVPTKYI
jgi:5-methylcytosine-specific restriction endonuclease McrA